MFVGADGGGENTFVIHSGWGSEQVGPKFGHGPPPPAPLARTNGARTNPERKEGVTSLPSFRSTLRLRHDHRETCFKREREREREKGGEREREREREIAGAMESRGGGLPDYFLALNHVLPLIYGIHGYTDH